MDPDRAATIASLWATLTETADTDPEAQIFLLMFGPWAGEQLDQIPKS
jgi:hypothetical protein